MTNVAKYLLLLESLNLTDDPDQRIGEEQRLHENNEKICKFVKTDPQQLICETIRRLNLSNESPPISINDTSVQTRYVIQMEHVLLEIVENTNFNSDAKEDLISTRHTNLCVEAIQDVSIFALREQLHPHLYQSKIFTKLNKSNCNPSYELLKITVDLFCRILQVRQFHLANAMELVLRDLMAAILSLWIAHELKEWTMTEECEKDLQLKLDRIWIDIAKVEYIRNVLLLKGIPNLPNKVSQKLHQNLVNKLTTNEGFATLVATLKISQRNKENVEHNEKRTFEVISNIVAFKGHTKRFQEIMIDRILKFIDVCLLNNGMADSMGAGLLTLRKLYDLRPENRIHIGNVLNESLKCLTQPEDLLSGLIVLEHKEFCLRISKFYHLFCTSSVECLPSELLIAYQPLLLQIYYNIPDSFAQKKQVAALITRCLNNRSQSELQEIIKRIYTLNLKEGWLQIQPRIMFCCNTQQTEITFKIGPADCKQDFNISLALPELLMNEEFHALTYQVFMVLLQLMADTLAEDTNNKSLDLIQTEDELVTFLNSEYPVKVEIVLSLNTLISHQPLRTQISENAKDFLRYLRIMIEKRLERLERSAESGDEVLLIMLTLSYEMLEQSQFPESFRDFVPILQKLQAQSPNKLIKQRINSLIILLNGELKAGAAMNTTAFNTARSLIESNESYLQVYGIQLLLDLLRRKDAMALANGHVIIALALSTLKDKESYTFLNCVRLFVGLVYVMESEVLEVLSDEYLRNDAVMDYRLVVGEAIIKVGQELGPLCYKYKGVLLNSFMQGVRSQLDEFRMSSFANLAQICRILSYQVHNFFQELLNIIDSELTTGKYLPAKRAAVLVLSELLQGIDNLIDFEDLLLPIYRILRDIEADENCDPKMRLHAMNGLKVLAEKCKKFLFAEQQLQKEIRIFGIKDEPKRKTKGHILELN